MQFEAHAGCPEWPTKPVDKDRLVLCLRLSSKERREQIRGFRPEWTDALFAPFAKQPDLRGWIQTEGSRAQIERLLNSGSCVVEEREKYMVALSHGG
jgi:hypothetical protein